MIYVTFIRRGKMNSIWILMFQSQFCELSFNKIKLIFTVRG